MNRARDYNPSAVLALVFSGGLVLASGAGFLVDHRSWLVRLGSLLIGLAIAALITWAWMWPIQKQMKVAHRYLDRLTRISPSELQTDTFDTQLPSLPVNHPLRDVADRLTVLLIEVCEKVQELEHVRNAADIHCRRASDERDRIKAILHGIEEPILAIDQFDELILANPSAEALLNFDATSTENRMLHELVKCEHLVNLLTTTCHRKNTQNCGDEIEITDESGERAWYRVTARRLVADTSGSSESDAESTGAVAVLRDIAETKALQHRNAEFVSSVSHEMKTPLAGIKAYVELLADGEAEDEQTREEFLEVISSQADRLQRLVENLLNLARMEAGVVKVDKTPRPLNEILEEAINIVRPSAEAKQITLIADLSPMYLGLLADRDMLLQAAINLLSNAIKYTPEGGQITLRSRMLDKDVRFEVEDTGVGLSEDDADHVFEKFYRVKKNRDMAPGTGLGLPLAKHIIEDVHGGTLTLQSALGRGSTFAVTIPGSGQMA